MNYKDEEQAREDGNEKYEMYKLVQNN